MAYLLFDPAADDWTPERLAKRAPEQPMVPVERTQSEEELIDEARLLIEEQITALQARVDALSRSVGGKPRAKSIIKQVALRHGHTVNDLLGRYRNVNIVLARDEACYRIRTETTLSYTAIAAVMGNRNHSTIMSAVRRHAELNNLPMPGERAKKNA